MRIAKTPQGLTVQDAIARAAAAIMTAFNKEHNAGLSTHSTINATGKIYEQGRTTAIGDRITPAFKPADYTANGSMTWVVATSGYYYTLAGGSMTVYFDVTGTVGGTPNTTVQIVLPSGFFPESSAYNHCDFSDAGTLVTGMAYVLAFGALNTNAINVRRQDSTVLTAGTAVVRGQISFPIRLTT